MSKWKYVIIATLLAIPSGWALRAQTSKPATLAAADYLEIQQLVARYSYAVDMHGGDGSAYAASSGTIGASATTYAMASATSRRRIKRTMPPM